MNLKQLSDLACGFFGVTPEELHGTDKHHEYIIPRHIFRATAFVDYKFKPGDIAELNGDRSAVHYSKKVVIDNGQFSEQYSNFKAFVKKQLIKSDTVIDPVTGVERITNAIFDERFYRHPKKINFRTGNNFFPAFHFITKMGSPEPIQLSKWRQEKGLWADIILKISNHIGTYVHDSIDNMIVHGTPVSYDQIVDAFPDWYEVIYPEKSPVRRVQEALRGFINFMNDEEPEILASEQMVVGEDFGFTMDLKARIKSDNYEKVWIIDWKTSKTASFEHKRQIESMRRVSGADRGAVCVLGNTTKNKYTLTKIPEKQHDDLWLDFTGVKNTAYIRIKKDNLVEPKIDDMPLVFNLDEVKFKRRFQ